MPEAIRSTNMSNGTATFNTDGTQLPFSREMPRAIITSIFSASDRDFWVDQLPCLSFKEALRQDAIVTGPDGSASHHQYNTQPHWHHLLHES